MPHVAEAASKAMLDGDGILSTDAVSEWRELGATEPGQAMKIIGTLKKLVRQAEAG